MKRRLRLFALLAASLTLGGCALWLDQERQWALRPTLTQPGDARPAGARDQTWLAPLGMPDGSLQRVSMWWLPHPTPGAPALLYLHGSFRNLSRNLPKMEALRAAGFSVLAVDYRGWGDSTPITPDEETIHADARLAFTELMRREPQASRRVIFGHSMGGAVAVRLASVLQGKPGPGQDYACLVLESTFTRMPDVAREAGGSLGRLAAWIATVQFDSAARIGAIDAPILMLHGQADRTVPVVLGRRLHERAPAGSRFIEFPGGSHSQLHREFADDYTAALRGVIQQLAP